MALAERNAARRVWVEGGSGGIGGQIARGAAFNRATGALSRRSLDHVDKLIEVAVRAKQYVETEGDESDAALVALTEALAALEKPI
jgi:short-subunit dehydrogenase